MSDFGRIPPNALQQPEPFTLRIDDDDVNEFKTLLRLSRIGPQTWENSQTGFGVTREWLSNVKETWLNRFEWRDHEKRINSFPNFKSTVNDATHGSLDIHFVGLFSTNQDAVPVIFLHGWPGSFMEFIPMLELLVEKYTPETLPYHVIIPSLPGYTLSSGPPLDRDFGMEDNARFMNQLMVDLGFGRSGYIVQGGDVGSEVARYMALRNDECKAVHLNMMILNENKVPNSMEGLTDKETAQVERLRAFQQDGFAYGMQHALRPATIGLVVSASPLALLAWVGEGFVEWVDKREPIPLDTILGMVTLYWLTSTFPRSIYPYRGYVGDQDRSHSGITDQGKPFGYSAYAVEATLPPKAWTDKLYPEMIRYEHEKGGHFGALEQPKQFLEVVEGFVSRLGHVCQTKSGSS